MQSDTGIKSNPEATSLADRLKHLKQEAAAAVGDAADERAIQEDKLVEVNSVLTERLKLARQVGLSVPDLVKFSKLSASQVRDRIGPERTRKAKPSTRKGAEDAGADRGADDAGSGA